MKTTITIGCLATLFVYVVISMHNKTWDIMNYSQDSVYWFGCFIFLAWFGVGTTYYLNKNT